MNMKERIKELRVRIDGLSQLAKELKPITNLEEQIVVGSHIVWDKKAPRSSKEIDKAYDSLILAKAWLGKVLGELGEPTPYANDGSRKTVDDIEPAADTSKVICTTGALVEKHYNDFNHIEKVDWLREEIEDVIKKTIPFVSVPFGNTVDYQTIIIQHLCEARFWLGFELQRIRESGQ